MDNDKEEYINKRIKEIGGTFGIFVMREIANIYAKEGKELFYFVTMNLMADIFLALLVSFKYKDEEQLFKNSDYIFTELKRFIKDNVDEYKTDKFDEFKCNK